MLPRYCGAILNPNISHVLIDCLSFKVGRGYELPLLFLFSNVMTKEQKSWIQYGSAVGMLVSGVGLTVAGFLVPPVGVISDSVLWYAAQTMIYAGSVFGVSVYVNERLSQFRKDLKKESDAKD